ncbi:hypothetical protein IG631_11290 [Alternaria alternata]|nr:hypothetical protein IG631_11290 [Alternaria alternata]
MPASVTDLRWLSIGILGVKLGTTLVTRLYSSPVEPCISLLDGPAIAPRQLRRLFQYSGRIELSESGMAHYIIGFWRSLTFCRLTCSAFLSSRCGQHAAPLALCCHHRCIKEA